MKHQTYLLALGLVLLVGVGSVLSAQSVPDGLYYKFNETSGTTASNSAFPGGGHANPDIGSGSTWESGGRLNGAIKFGGQVPMDTGFQVTLNQSWTMELWVNHTTGSIQYPMGSSTTAVDFRMFTAGAAGVTSVTLRGGGFAFMPSVTTDANGVFDGTWNHIAFVFNDTASTLSFYINGIHIQTLANQSPSATPITLVLGAYSTNVSRYNGLMDDFRWWSSARTQAEIQANYQNELFNMDSLVVHGGDDTGRVGVGIDDVAIGTYTVEAIGPPPAPTQGILQIAFEVDGNYDPNDVFNFKLWHDVGGTGTVDPLVDQQLGGTTSVSGGRVTFVGSPLLSIPPGAPVHLVVTCDISPTAAGGSTIGVVLDDESDIIMTSTDPIIGNFPMRGGLKTAVSFSATVPWTYDFGSTWPSNVLREFEAGEYPTAPNGIYNPTSFSSTNNDAEVDISSGETNMQPRSAGGMGMISFPNGQATGAMDFLFDLSAWDANQDQLEFEFYWARDNFISNATSNPFSHVFISNDGGANWRNAIHFFDAGVQEHSWNRARLGLTPALTFFGFAYSNAVVVRVQAANSGSGSVHRALYIDDVRLYEADAEVHVTVGELAAGSGTGPRKPEDPVMIDPMVHNAVLAFDVRTIGKNHPISSVLVQRFGSLPDNAFAELGLWRDDGDGIFNPAFDTQVGQVLGGFSGGEAVFAGMANAVAMGYVSQRFFVTVAMDPAVAQPGGTIGMRIPDMQDITFGITTVETGDYPIVSGLQVAGGPVSVLPWADDFNGEFLPSNAFYHVERGDYPNATSVGTTVTTGSTTTEGDLIWATGNYSGITPYKGGNMMLMSFENAATSAAAIDFHFDLSAYNINADKIEFSIRYNEYLMSTTATYANYNYVFISTNGGADWHAAGEYLNPAGPDRVWRLAVVDLQDILTQAQETYTSQIVVRVQGSSISYSHAMTFNDARMRVVSDSLEVQADQRADMDLFGAIDPNVEHAVVGAFDLISHGQDQTITDVTIRNVGSLPDSDILEVNLWEGGELFNPATATHLTSGLGMTFTSGLAHFTGLTYDVNAGHSNEKRIWVTVTLASNAPRGEMVQIAIHNGDIELDGFDPILGLPIECEARPVLAPTSSFPFVADLRPVGSARPYLTMHGRPGDYPMANSAGETPGVFTASRFAFPAMSRGRPLSAGTGVNNETILPPDSRGMVAFETHQAGTSSGTEHGVAAVDFHFDLSDYAAHRDQFLFSFAWRSRNYTTSYSETYNVFVSTDGGNSWLTSLFKMTPSAPAQQDWQHQTVDVSAGVRLANGSFSDNVVVRIQSKRFYYFLEHSQIGGVSMVRGASLSIERNNNRIQPGAFDSLGTMVAGVPMTYTYTLRNEGVNTLNLTDPNTLTIVSPFNANVTVSNPPASSSIDGGASAQVSIQVTAQGPGPVLFAIQMTSTDTLKSPYVFTVTGTGLAPRAALQRTLGETIQAGGVDNVGNRPAGVNTTLNYFILNQGSATLQLQGNPPVAVVSADNVDVSIIQQPTSSLLAPSGFQSFAIEITPQLGAFSFELVIPNNDVRAPEYNVTVSGNGSETSSLTLRDADGGAIIPHTQVYTTSNLAPGSSRELTFLIENTGNANLQLIGNPAVQVISQNNVAVEVTQQPLQSNLAPGNFTPTVIKVTPNTIGSFNSEIRILSNDDAVPSYLFTIAGFSARSSGGKDGGCSAGGSNTGYTWIALLAILATLGVAARRTRRARTNG